MCRIEYKAATSQLNTDSVIDQSESSHVSNTIKFNCTHSDMIYLLTHVQMTFDMWNRSLDTQFPYIHVCRLKTRLLFTDSVFFSLWFSFALTTTRMACNSISDLHYECMWSVCSSNYIVHSVNGKTSKVYPYPPYPSYVPTLWNLSSVLLSQYTALHRCQHCLPILQKYM